MAEAFGFYSSVTKSSYANVYSLGVVQRSGVFVEYVEETNDSSKDLICEAYGRKNVTDDYVYIVGTELIVDNLESAELVMNIAEYTFVRIKLRGWGKGWGSITSK